MIEYTYENFDGEEVNLNDIESAIDCSEMDNKNEQWARYDAGPFKEQDLFPHGGNEPGLLTLVWDVELSVDDKGKLDVIVGGFQ